MSDVQELTFTAESQLRRPGRLLRELRRDLAAALPLAWVLLLRNIRSQYRQTLLGYVWAFVPPLATTLVWVVLSGQQVVRFGPVDMPYPVFVFSGMVLWMVFVDALQAPLRVVSASGKMLANVRFPREALILTGVGEALFTLAMRGALLVVVLAAYGTPLRAGVLLVPLAIGSLLLLGTALGVLLTPVGLLYHDVGRGLSLATQFWLYLTPVVYPAPQGWPGSLLTWLNPVSPAVLAGRDWLLRGQSAHVEALCVVSAGAAALLVLALLFYRLTIPLIVERLHT